jgi:RNA polymerase sigma-70 factor (ECF subfamily)
VINSAQRGHEEVMAHVRLTLGDHPVEAVEGPGVSDVAADKRLRALVDAYYDFVWRSLRRLGVANGDVDDAAQRVYSTLARKLGSVRPGSERSFLFQTALPVAADCRRTRRRRREVAEVGEDEAPADPSPSGEDLLDLRRAREHLDRILDGMSLELRAVFVLFELDEMTMAEIAELLEVPAGTVASRLRRARAEFRQKVESMPLPKIGGGAT